MSQQPDLRQIIREEYLKCAADPAHFMKKYCNIQHPQRGRVLFNLYPFQEKTLRLFRDNPYSIVLKISPVRYINISGRLFFMVNVIS
jgi:hypothetical protein